MLLSVIIPVYNVERYLKQCIDSVLAKIIDNTEIILVNDGSTDHSPKICDEYAKKHPCISVIHKANGGISSARNAGIEKATGEYITFLDSDDWWNPDVDLHSIMDFVLSKPNIEMFLLTSLDYAEGVGLYKRSEHTNLESIRTTSIPDYYSDLLNNGNLEVHTGTKIIKTEFLKNNNLYFKQGIVSEDNEWMLRLLRCLKNVEIINQPIYIYRMGRAGSITNSIKAKNIFDMLSIIEDSIAYYSANSNSELKTLELCYCAYLWFSALGLSNQLSRDDKKALKKHFKNTGCVCKYSNSPKTLLAYRIYKIFGMWITTKLLGKYIELKAKKNINKAKVVDKT